MKPEEPNPNPNPNSNPTPTKPTGGLASIQRPGSSQGFTIKTLGSKPLSSTMKEIQLESSGAIQGSTNIQGNIIHITVNNYITNSNITTNNVGMDNTQGKAGRKATLDEISSFARSLGFLTIFSYRARSRRS